MIEKTMSLRQGRIAERKYIYIFGSKSNNLKQKIPFHIIIIIIDTHSMRQKLLGCAVMGTVVSKGKRSLSSLGKMPCLFQAVPFEGI